MTLLHSLICQKPLAEQYEKKKDHIVLGIFSFLASQVDNDTFCKLGQQNFAQYITQIVDYPNDYVYAECEKVIHLYCEAGFKVDSQVKDLRYLIFRQCLNNCRPNNLKPSVYPPVSLYPPNFKLPKSARRVVQQPPIQVESPNQSNSSSFVESADSSPQYVHKKRTTVFATDRTSILDRNSNAYVMDYHNTRKSFFFDPSDDSSSDSFPEDGSEDHSNDPDFKLMASISSVLNVMVTFYQCVPFITILQEKYSTFYEQLLESFNQLKEYVIIYLASDF